MLVQHTESLWTGEVNDDYDEPTKHQEHDQPQATIIGFKLG